MPAGRMTRNVDPVGIAAIVLNICGHPTHRFPALTDLLRHIDFGDKRVVDHDGDKAGSGETRCDIRTVGLVIADPITTVDVDLHRGETSRLRSKDIEALA